MPQLFKAVLHGRGDLEAAEWKVCGRLTGRLAQLVERHCCKVMLWKCMHSVIALLVGDHQPSCAQIIHLQSLSSYPALLTALPCCVMICTVVTRLMTRFANLQEDVVICGVALGMD